MIFLGDEKVEKFDMKFNFKENIKNKKATYGFLYLPTKNTEYIVLGKHYREYYEKITKSAAINKMPPKMLIMNTSFLKIFYIFIYRSFLFLYITLFYRGGGSRP